MKCFFNKHDYLETVRYLMSTGEDRVFYECSKCRKETEEFSLDTYVGKANAPSYSELYKSKH
jgi:hypothetical protein